MARESTPEDPARRVTAARRLQKTPPERPPDARSDYEELEGDVKAAVGRFVGQVWNGHDGQAAGAFVADDFRDHDPYPGQGPGRQGFEAYVRSFLAAFPDVVVTIDDIVAQGSKVAMRLSWQATHRGEYLGIGPTGRTVRGRQMEFLRLRNGQMVERWALLDRPWLREQLTNDGVPDPGAEGEPGQIDPSEEVPGVTSVEDARTA